MTEINSPITEEELHAYVDNELAADRKAAVLEWLAAHPEAAAQVAGWRAQAEAIRARYGSIAAEGVPDRLRLAAVTRRGRSWAAVAAAASVAAFLAGGAAGWIAHGASAATPSGFETVTTDALDAYKLYVVEVRHPVEVNGDDRTHMSQWLTKRLGYQQNIPDLEKIGLKLVGGRLLPGATGAAAFYMYETGSGERFTIYCLRAGAPDTALRYRQQGDNSAAFYWVDKDVAYVVSGPADRNRLEKVTQAIYEQVDKTQASKS